MLLFVFKIFIIKFCVCFLVNKMELCVIGSKLFFIKMGCIFFNARLFGWILFLIIMRFILVFFIFFKDYLISFKLNFEWVLLIFLVILLKIFFCLFKVEFLMFLMILLKY